MKDSLGKWGGELSVQFNLGCVKFQVSLSQQGEGTYWGIWHMYGVQLRGKLWPGSVNHQCTGDCWNQRASEVIYEKNKEWEESLHEYLVLGTETLKSQIKKGISITFKNEGREEQQGTDETTLWCCLKRVQSKVNQLQQALEKLLVWWCLTTLRNIRSMAFWTLLLIGVLGLLCRWWWVFSKWKTDWIGMAEVHMLWFILLRNSAHGEMT